MSYLRRFSILLPLAFVALALMVPSRAPSAPSAYVVIIHPDNPMQSLDRRELSDLFLKRVTIWPNDEAVRPIDQLSTSEVRRSFVTDVLKRSVSAVRSYWQQILFSGRGLPPPELESDEAVIEYVLRYRGAVGYVSPHAQLGEAKVLRVE